MAAADGEDWRIALPPQSRTRIVNKITLTLTRHLPPGCGPDGLQQIMIMATRFEEKIYAAAQSQMDYLRRISIKMLTMESKAVGSNAPSGEYSFNAPPYDEY